VTTETGDRTTTRKISPSRFPSKPPSCSRFQWVTSEEALEENTENIREEIADILIYSLTLCSELGFDVKEIVEEKIVKNGLKYPVK